MGYHPRIESSKVCSFQTSRTCQSELWFVNNPELEKAILGYAAKYSVRYKIKLYALAIEGNHIQFPARFRLGNRAHFMRDFNSSVARALPRYQKAHKGGRLWARRYSAEYLPAPEDILEQFFYTVLQPVQDGLVDSIYDYPGYNCFEDAVNGIAREFKLVRWKEYNDARRWNKDISIDDYTDTYELKYQRLPGYEKTSTEEYIQLMRDELQRRTKQIIENRGDRKSLGREKLKRIRAGALPKKTKRSSKTDHRPRVLSTDSGRRSVCKAWYFSIYYYYRKASVRYRSGKITTAFPPGTYRPPAFTIVNTDPVM